MSAIGSGDCSVSFIIEYDPHRELKPVRVIYNNRYTICYWEDGTKTVVKATDDETPTKEHGVAMCIMRKLFDTRGEFLRIVNNGYDVNKQEEIEENPSIENKRFGFGRKKNG